MNWEQGQDPTVPAVHLAPDDGLQTFVRPYPALTHDGSHRGPLVPGRSVVEVVGRQGEWVQIAVDGTEVGWVEGQRLIPPVGAAARATLGVPPPIAPPARPPSGVPYGYAGGRPVGNGFAVASLVLGILATVFAFVWVFFVLGLVLGGLAIVFGWLGLRRGSERGVGNGQAIAGLVLGIIGFGLALVMAVVFGTLFRSVSHAIDQSVQPTVDADRVADRVEIGRCNTTIGAAEASGTLVNAGNETRNLRVHVKFYGPGGEGDGYGTAYSVPAGATGNWSVQGPAATSLTGCSVAPSPTDPRPPLHPADPAR